MLLTSDRAADGSSERVEAPARAARAPGASEIEPSDLEASDLGTPDLGAPDLGSPPAAAAAVFGSALPLAEAYARMLCGPGTERGIVGPREAPRIWDRHLLNCATIAALMPPGAAVVDIGSGGGLPGIVLALVRPDLRLTLVESMARRTTFLAEVVAELDLGDRVEVVRGRAEELRRRDDVATARAVGDPLRLARWSTRLLRPKGELIALCGSSVADEIGQTRPVLERSGWTAVSVEPASLPGVTSALVLRARRR